MNKLCRVMMVSAVLLFGSCLISKGCCEDKAVVANDSVSKLQKKVILSLEKIEERIRTGSEGR